MIEMSRGQNNIFQNHQSQPLSVFNAENQLLMQNNKQSRSQKPQPAATELKLNQNKNILEQHQEEEFPESTPQTSNIDLFMGKRNIGQGQTAPLNNGAGKIPKSNTINIEEIHGAVHNP
jgi:hypothetical protein